jgi:hypothetical protein
MRGRDEHPTPCGRLPDADWFGITDGNIRASRQHVGILGSKTLPSAILFQREPTKKPDRRFTRILAAGLC